MKKILALVLVLAMALSLVACGGSSNPETPAAPEAGNAGSENAAPATTQDTLIIRGSGDPMSFNPSAAADDNYYYAAQNMFHLWPSWTPTSLPCLMQLSPGKFPRML